MGDTLRETWGNGTLPEPRPRGGGLLRRYAPHREAVALVVPIPGVQVRGVEVEVATVVGVIGSCRPVVAVRAAIVQAAGVPVVVAATDVGKPGVNRNRR